MKISWGMLPVCVALSVSASAQTNTVIVPVSNTFASPYPGIAVEPNFAASEGWVLSASYASGAAIMIGRNSSGDSVTEALPSYAGGNYVTYGQAYDLDGDRALVYDFGSTTDIIPPRVYAYRNTGNGWGYDTSAVFVQPHPSSFLGSLIKIDGERSLLGNWVGAVLYGPSESAQPLYPNWAVPFAVNSMDIDGDVIALGIPSRRSVLVFLDRPGFGFQLRHVLRSDGTVTDGTVVPAQVPSCFGWSVAISGDTVFVSDTDQSSPPKGRVRVFGGAGTVNMAWLGDLEASDSALVAGSSFLPCRFVFGTELGASDSRLLVSAPRNQAREGACYLFERDPGEVTGWGESAKFVPADGHSELTFSSNAQIDGDRVWFHANRQTASGPRGVAMYLDLPPGETEYSALCHGNGGATAGCTPCPCGNDRSPSSVGGCLNSSGIGARLAAKGRASLSNDTLALEVSGAIPDTFALLARGSVAAPSFPGAPCPPGSGVTKSGLDGLLCLGGNLARLSPRPVDANGEVGVTNNGWGEGIAPLIAGRGFVAGQTVHFQTVYRDAPTGGSACGTRLNTTNALRVVVQA